MKTPERENETGNQNSLSFFFLAKSEPRVAYRLKLTFVLVLFNSDSLNSKGVTQEAEQVPWALDWLTDYFGILNLSVQRI